jgi:hypothetical protein
MVSRSWLLAGCLVFCLAVQPSQAQHPSAQTRPGSPFESFPGPRRASAVPGHLFPNELRVDSSGKPRPRRPEATTVEELSSGRPFLLRDKRSERASEANGEALARPRTGRTPYQNENPPRIAVGFGRGVAQLPPTSVMPDPRGFRGYPRTGIAIGFSLSRRRASVDPTFLIWGIR